jgi:dihydroxyacetone kinase
MTTTRAKKLINAPENVVEEALQGLLLAHPKTLARLDDLHVLLRADYAALKSQQVALISGGGSGHEPAHGGFVADGMLTAAVLGGVFASPSVASILAAIRAVTGPRGTLLIVKRYTGDLLNFGMAREQALSEGLQVEMVVVADDCALPQTKGITGRRGVAGTVLVHKIAGAAAAAGLDLSKVKTEAEQAIANMGSLGLALSVCTVPGSTHSTRLDGDTVELGMGIHGEEGIERMPVQPVDVLTERMLQTIISKEGEGGHGYLPLIPNQDVALLVNNLGATPPIELSLVVRRAVQVLESAPISARIHRVFVGTFMTALEMAGVSLTILRVTPECLARLDAPTTAPGWLPAEVRVPGTTGSSVPVPPAPKSSIAGTDDSSASTTSMLPREVLSEYQDAGKLIIDRLIEARDRLNELDGKGGDGDCGVTLERGAKAAMQVITDVEPCNASEYIFSVANAISDSMGGTSGALLEIFFRALARSLSEQQAVVPTPGQWAIGVEHGVERMSFYSGAKPGYRTMLDAWIPASDALLAGKGVEGAAAAARAGAEATKTMEAMAGRANYVPASVTQGHADPGAEAVAMAFEAMWKNRRE